MVWVDLTNSGTDCEGSACYSAGMFWGDDTALDQPGTFASIRMKSSDGCAAFDNGRLISTDCNGNVDIACEYECT